MLLFGFYDAVNWPFHYFFMAFFFIMGAVLWLRSRQEDKGWQALSTELEMEFQEKVDRGYKVILGRFELLGGGSIDQLTQMLSGTYRGWKMYAFNWFYRSDLSLDAVRGGFACVILELSDDLGRFRLFPDEMDDFLSSLDSDRIVIGPEAFHQRYRLACRGRTVVDALFTDEMIQAIMDGPGLLIEASEKYLLFAWQGELLPGDTLAQLDRVVALAEKIPQKLLPHK